MFGETSIADISTIVAQFTPVGACFIFLIKIWFEFKKLQNRSDHRQEDVEVLLICMRGCLEGLVAANMNGQVAAALKTLNKYQAKKTSGRSG